MNRIEFKLSMPNVASWNGKWSGEGRNYVRYRNLTDKKLAELDLIEKGHNSWYHGWSDGWGASVSARVMEKGEKKQKSVGFAGYDWMIDNILIYNDTKEPGKNN